MATRTLAILIDDPGRVHSFRYVLSLLVECWRQDGWRVLWCDDFRALPEADLALLHVNRTVVPESLIAALERRYARVINLATGDISKKRVSRHLLRPGDDYAGPVIVKTDANCGGRRERYGRPVFGALSRLGDRVWPWSLAARLAAGRYPVYPGIAAVPEVIWGNPALVVERFRSERQGELFALRQWVFFGDREIHRVSYSREAIVKSHNVVRSAVLDAVPDSLRRRRQELGFDYGKFDYVMSGDEAFLFDANRTPTYGRKIGPEIEGIARTLAEGMRSFR